MPEVTKEQVKRILEKNGITSIEDLARLLAEKKDSVAGTVLKVPTLDEVASSWFIKVWKLDKRLEDLDISELPNELGGNILQ